MQEVSQSASLEEAATPMRRSGQRLSPVRCRSTEARLTPRVLAIAATLYCPERYISWATWSLCGHHRGSAAVAATCPGGGQPGGRALADQVAFELGQGGEDVEDKLAAGSGGVDRLLEAAEPDAAVGTGAAGGLGEHPIAAGPLQGVDLEVWLLVGGGDAGIADSVRVRNGPPLCRPRSDRWIWTVRVE
jgi:hypothetical protein